MRNRTIWNWCLCYVFASVLLWAIIIYFSYFYESTDIVTTVEKNSTQSNEVGQEFVQFLPHDNANNDKKKNEHNRNFNTQTSEQQDIENDIQDPIFPAINRMTSGSSERTYESPVIAVLVIACNRVTVQRSLDQLIKYRPDEYNFPIIVSQDCGHQPTAEVISSYGDKIAHIKHPDLSDIEIPESANLKGYYKIARHYRWALNQVFDNLGYETAIIVEDDLDIAPDFYEYFLATYPLLMKDPSLWCVSAWNDNGKSNLIDLKSPQLLHRTDFFPGLGWMLTQTVWRELSSKWPRAYWDDWMRRPEQRKNRACIRPEIPRTSTFGRIGVSNGQFYDSHLQFINLNKDFVAFTKLELKYLLKGSYDNLFAKEVYESEVIAYTDLETSENLDSSQSVRIPYNTREAFESAARAIGLMDDFKSGVPRTAYHGVVSFFYKGLRVYLAPYSTWTGYDLSWK